MILNNNLDIRISNSIQSLYRDLLSISGENIEYSNLYTDVQHETLKSTFSTLHHHYISLFESMNKLLPTREQEAHFWAEPSRHLITVINVTQRLQRTLKSTSLAFDIDRHYYDMIELCNTFLSNSGGSTVPQNTEKVELYYEIPIFTSASIISINSTQEKSYSLQLIGKGSYAQVFKYRDENYQKDFVVKRALENLNDKELTRFKQEFDVMKDLIPLILSRFIIMTEKKINIQWNLWITLLMITLKTIIQNYYLANEKVLEIKSLRLLLISIQKAYFIEILVPKIF